MTNEYGLYDGVRVHAIGVFTSRLVRHANAILRTEGDLRWILAKHIPKAVRDAEKKSTDQETTRGRKIRD
jgi:hypothetical protein